MKSGPDSQIISQVIGLKSIPGSLEALDQCSVSTIERKWGKNTEEHIDISTHFGPLLPNCKSGMLFGLACKKAKSWLG